MATEKRDLTNHSVQGQPSAADLPQVLLPVEAAEFLRISLDQLYHLTSKKKVPFTKVGGALRFDRDRLAEFVAGNGSERTFSPVERTSARKTPGRGSKTVIASEPGPISFMFKTPPRQPRGK